MASILMAFDDVGLAVRLQETLEVAGNTVDWNVALAGGPGEECELTPDLVLLSGDTLGERAPEVIEQWRDLDPPPAILVMGSHSNGQELAYRAKASFLDAGEEGPELIDAVSQAMSMRFAARLSSSFARGALNLVAGPSDEEDALRILMASRNADIQTVRASLRWYAYNYVTANEMIAELRKERGLQISEVEFTHLLDGARTVRTALQQAGMDGETAARCLWALASIGAVEFTVEPPDMKTVKRRAVRMSRDHLRARRGHVANKTYYDVLEVTRDATPEEVDLAARMLSVRFSPDRLGAIDLGDCEQLVAQTWKEIYDAHRVLRDENMRYRYDVEMSTHDELETTWGAEVYDRETAEVFFNRGQQALIDGEPYAAVSNIAAAARNHPDHPDYEATLAWARYRADVDRGDDRDEVARRERAAAEKLTMGRRPWPRSLVAIGLLSAANGDSEAARWWLREALTCDPNLPAARQLLSRLHRRS